MAEITQTFPTDWVAPERGVDSQSVFSTKANTAWKKLESEITPAFNAFGGEANALRDEVNTLRNDTVNAEASISPYYTDIDTIVTNIADVTTVSTNIADVNAVATNETNINTVATNILDINNVASDIANINVVASDIININSVATNIANVNIAATNETNINTVSTNIVDVQTVSSNISDIGTVADNVPAILAAEFIDDVVISTTRAYSNSKTNELLALKANTSDVYIKSEIDDYVGQPTHTGTATFTAIDNQIIMTGIVTALGLEVGDVIEFTSGTDANNAKLRTVETITDDNTIVVNYEHCGGRGNGPLKLTDESVSCAVKRVAKWYNAPIGLGQEFVDLTSFRANDTTYTNSTRRSIKIKVLTNSDNNNDTTFFVNSTLVDQFGEGTGFTGTVNGSVGEIVTPASDYKCTCTFAGSLSAFFEMR